jgi:hypothetical protein
MVGFALGLLYSFCLPNATPSVHPAPITTQRTHITSLSSLFGFGGLSRSGFLGGVCFSLNRFKAALLRPAVEAHCRRRHGCCAVVATAARCAIAESRGAAANANATQRGAAAGKHTGGLSRALF